MITSMIPNVENVFKNHHITNLTFLSIYNPYINYSWSQALTVGGNQQIKDIGTAGLNLQQFFGQGCWFNGIDMQITIPVNATIQTEIKRVNGVAEINTNTQVLTNYNVYSGSGAKVYKDLYMFNRLLTQAEIDKYNNQPNEFFMDSLEDSSCTLAMPMCEKDNLVRNYKSYSYSSFLINAIGLKSSTHTGTRIAQLSAGLLVQAGKTYLIKYSFIGNANITNFKAYIPPASNGGTGIAVEIAITNTNNEFIVTIPTTYTTTADGFYCWLGVNGTSISVNFDEASIREISGIYPISNYLTTCRTNAQRLPYGLQTSGFKRDTNGLILSKSNFLEADGVGYGDTGYISPLAVVTESFEFIIKKPKVVQSSFTKYVCGGASSVDMVVEISSGSNITGLVRLRKVGQGFGSAQWLPTNTMLVTLICDGTNVYIYFNAVLSGTYVAQPYTASHPIKLMADYGITNQIIEGKLMNQAGLRLAKVHQKALSQEEITKNFNKYQAQGLLNE